MRFLFVDRIIESIPAKHVRGLKHIRKDDYYLYESLDGQRYFPSSLIGEALGQLAAWNVMAANDFTARPVAGVVSAAFLHRPVKAGETIELESFIDSLDEASVLYHSVAKVGDEDVFTIEGALGPLLPMSQFISTDEVRSQYESIYLEENAALSSVGIHKNNFLSSLVFDKITESIPGQSLVAEKLISKDAAFFPDHFPKNPVLPMTVLLEAKLDLAKKFLEQANLSSQYKIKVLRKIKMNEFVKPGDLLRCYVQLQSQDQGLLVLRYCSEVNGKRVCVLDVHMEAEG